MTDIDNGKSARMVEIFGKSPEDLTLEDLQSVYGNDLADLDEPELDGMFAGIIDRLRPEVVSALMKRYRAISKPHKMHAIYKWAIVGLLAIGVIMVLQFIFFGEKVVNKAQLRDSIITAINNGADHKAIQHIYSNREVNKTTIFSLFSLGSRNYYPYTKTLSQVLRDIHSELFLSKKPVPTQIAKIEKLIKEYTDLNPYDKLQMNQQEYFENIKIKLNFEAEKIANDLDKLADELFDKNELVQKYLANSRRALYISYVALLISLLIGLYQSYKSSDKRTIEIATKVVNRTVPRSNIKTFANLASNARFRQVSQQTSKMFQPPAHPVTEEKTGSGD